MTIAHTKWSEASLRFSQLGVQGSRRDIIGSSGSRFRASSLDVRRSAGGTDQLFSIKRYSPHTTRSLLVLSLPTLLSSLQTADLPAAWIARAPWEFLAVK